MTTVLLAPFLFRPFCRPASFPPVSVSHYAILWPVIVVVVVDVCFSVFLLFPFTWLFGLFESQRGGYYQLSGGQHVDSQLLSLSMLSLNMMTLNVKHFASNMLYQTCCIKQTDSQLLSFSILCLSMLTLTMLTLNC